jgi:hypothetical protein
MASGDPRKRTAKKTSTKKAASGVGRARPRPTTVTPASEWLADAEGQLLELPSGKVVRAIMPGIQAFVNADIIPNELMPIVMRAIDEQQPMAKSEVEDLARDPGLLVKLADAFDKIFVHCVTEPRFELPPDEDDAKRWNEAHPDDQVKGPAELRVEGTLYVDRVHMEDKSYIFNVAVGGTRDLEQFRAESAAQLASLPTG